MRYKAECYFTGAYKIVRQQQKIPCIARDLHEKRVMGIEPTLPAWKAGVLPLNYTRK